MSRNLLILALAAMCTSTSALAQTYRAVPFQPLPGTFIVDVLDINDSFQAVGTVTAGQAVIWDRSPQARSLGLPLYVVSLQINNAGLIAGTRLVGTSGTELFLIRNGTYVALTPPFRAWSVIELTDSGFLLLWDSTNRVSWLWDGSQFHHLADVSYDINDAGVIATRGGLRFPDGRLIRPWPEDAAVTTVGRNGDFAGAGCAVGPACTLLYGRRDFAITRHTMPVPSLGWTDMNAFGEVAGTVWWDPGPFYIIVSNFVYADGRFIDVDEIMRPRGWVVCDTTAITDQGALVVTAIPTTRLTDCDPVLLIPDPPAAPLNLVARVNARRVTLSWQSGSDVRDHVIEVGSAPGASNLLRMSIGAQQSFSAPAPPGRYYVRIRARNGVGTSPPSAELIVDVP